MAHEKNSVENSGFDSHAFLDLIEKATDRPESFSQQVAESVKNNPEACVPLLLKVFENSDEANKRFVADLFKTHLKFLANTVLLSAMKMDQPEKFFWIASILSELGEKKVIPVLIEGLKSTIKNTVIASLKGLSQFREPEALQAQIDFFLSNSDWVHLTVAMRHLALRASEVIPKLMSFFPEMKEERKAWILKFLAETGDPGSLTLFKEVLERETTKLGMFCIHGLGKIGSPEAIAILAKNLSNPEWFVRKKIIDALGVTKSKEAIPPLIKGLTDISLQVRAGAIEGLTKVGHYDIETLVGELGSGAHDLRVGLIRVLGKTHDARAVKPLVGTLSDRTTLFFSLDALGDLGFVEAAPALESFINDPDWFNRLNALEALSKLHPPNIRNIAEKCLEDPNDMVRISATRIFSQTGE